MSTANWNGKANEMGRDERLNMAAREAAPLLDRFRRPLFPGVKVEFHPRLPLVYDIIDIRPVVDPRQPAGLYQLTLTTSIAINAFGGAPIEELTAVVYPKAVEVDKKPVDAAAAAEAALPLPTLPKQDDDSPAGPHEYVPPNQPDGPEKPE